MGSWQSGGAGVASPLYPLLTVYVITGILCCACDKRPQYVPSLSLKYFLSTSQLFSTLPSTCLGMDRHEMLAQQQET